MANAAKVTLKHPKVQVCRDVRDGKCIEPTHRADATAKLWMFSSFEVDGPGGVTISLVMRDQAGREVYRLGPAPLARGGQLPPRRLELPIRPGRYVVKLEGEFVEGATARRPITNLPEWELTITSQPEN